MKRLIQVHSQDPHYICCSCCDETSESDSFVWYKELQENEKYFEPQTYLDCCKDKVGVVIDWFNLEDYERTTGFSTLFGVKVRYISGYSSN